MEIKLLHSHSHSMLQSYVLALLRGETWMKLLSLFYGIQIAPPQH